MPNHPPKKKGRVTDPPISHKKNIVESDDRLITITGKTKGKIMPLE